MSKIIIPKVNWNFPLAAERDYQKFMRAMVRRMAAIVRGNQPRIMQFIQQYKIKFDADDDDFLNADMDMAIDLLIEKISREYYEKMTQQIINNKVRQMFDRVNNLNKNEYQKTMKSVLAVDIFASEPWLNRASNLWVRENVKLIKSIESQYFGKIETMVTGAVKEGMLANDLGKKISELTGVSERRANIIARDQIGKLNGQLTKFRQKGIGIEKYRWNTAGDRRVRPDHQSRNGKEYSWDNPPTGGHPGEAIMCRCNAIAVIDLDKIGYVTQPQTQSLGAGSGNYGTPKHDPPRLVGEIDPNNDSLIKSKLKAFEQQIVDSAVENAMVVTRTGKVYHCKGTANQVFVDDLGDELRGASVTHNHPADETEYSFSLIDFKLFMDYNLDVLRGVDEKYEYELSRKSRSIDSHAMLFDEDAYQHDKIIKQAEQAGVGYRRRNRE